jgi:heterodisulfide reductase subunit A
MAVEVNTVSPSTIDNSDLRTGVVICSCGGKISSVLDFEGMQKELLASDGICHVGWEAYPCSKDGLDRLQSTIQEHQLDRVLIAGCAPRLVEKLFQEAVVQTGMAKEHLHVINLREHCALIHSHDPEQAIQKALDMIRIGTARLLNSSSPSSYQADILQKALVIGSDLSALVAAHTLAEEGIQVMLIEAGPSLGLGTPQIDDTSQKFLLEFSDSVSNHPNIDLHLNTLISRITGIPGSYETTVTSEKHSIVLHSGAILIATGLQEEVFEGAKWVDRTRVITQSEFFEEMGTLNGDPPPFQDVVLLLDDLNGGLDAQISLYWKTCLRQAIHALEGHPDLKVTLLFHKLPHGGRKTLENFGLGKAIEMGMKFFRYHPDHPPVIEGNSIEVLDPSMNHLEQIPFDRLVLTKPHYPHKATDRIASMLDLPQDVNGFLVDERYRLRPGAFSKYGIYILGNAHQAIDNQDALFQGYLIGSRAINFLKQAQLTIERPIAEILPALCTGCANCVQACPTKAIQLEKRDESLSLAVINTFRCIGCGNCLVVCPTRAIDLPGWENETILAQISAALHGIMTAETPPQVKPIIAFACEWSAVAAADLAGINKLSIPPAVHIIPLNCSTRLDPIHVLWALLNGAGGVFVGACQRGECHYGKGNLTALARIESLKGQLNQIDYAPDRVHLEFLKGDDGAEFVNAMIAFNSKISSLPKIPLEG